MSNEPEDIDEWSKLPAEERRAIRRAAQSQIWWAAAGHKIRGLGPLVTLILAVLALWQITGEGMREWLSR